MRLTPAAVVIKEFGLRPLARDLPCSHTTIWRWRSSDRGLVPSAWHQRLLELARKQNKHLTAEELVNGRVVRNR